MNLRHEAKVDLAHLSDDDLSRAVLKAMYPIPQLIVTGVIPVRQP